MQHHTPAHRRGGVKHGAGVAPTARARALAGREGERCSYGGHGGSAGRRQCPPHAGMAALGIVRHALHYGGLPACRLPKAAGARRRTLVRPRTRRPPARAPTDAGAGAGAPHIMMICSSLATRGVGRSPPPIRRPELATAPVRLVIHRQLGGTTPYIRRPPVDRHQTVRLRRASEAALSHWSLPRPWVGHPRPPAATRQWPEARLT